MIVFNKCRLNKILARQFITVKVFYARISISAHTVLCSCHAMFLTYGAPYTDPAGGGNVAVPY